MAVHIASESLGFGIWKFALFSYLLLSVQRDLHRVQDYFKP